MSRTRLHSRASETDPLFSQGDGGASAIWKATTVKPRLGQGSFRYLLQTVNRKCAVTREHSLPALDAAYIVPYSHGATHEVPNGLLLCADIHKMIDRDFVTVTPDYRFRVSRLLDERFQNGRAYYQLEGSEVWVPESAQDRPREEYLEMHSEETFLG